MGEGAAKFSVIIASYGRPDWLRRCLTGVMQLDYPSFEVIVVADQTGLSAIEDHPARHLIKLAEQEAPNISLARNAGIALAAGSFLAFIDDDAVPEPMWLRHHADALATHKAAASVGYVRGRNGISFQSQVESVDAEAETHRELSPPEQSIVPELATGRALKLVGTNMVFSRELLCRLGGFDAGYRYFLEDTDISLRLAHSAETVVAAPLAEVHHASAASVRRTPQRRPRSLYDIGWSSALFFRRHRPSAIDLFERIWRREELRLHRHLIQGTCEPRDIRQLLASLESGWRDAQSAELDKLTPISTKPPPFRAMSVNPEPHRVLTSRFIGRSAVIAAAVNNLKAGARTSVFSFSLTARPQRVRFLQCGVWLQSGGQFGQSTRDRPFFKWCRFAERTQEEIRRVAKQRGISEN